MQALTRPAHVFFLLPPLLRRRSVDDEEEKENSTSFAGNIIACAVVCWVLCGVGVTARFYVRGRILKLLGREDWCVLVAYLLSLGFTVATIFQCKYGMGSHFKTVPLENFPKYMLSSFIGTLFYQLSLAFSKISILFLYIRVFQYHWAYRAAWVMLSIVVLYNVWGFCSTMTLCVPLHKYWNAGTDGTCKPAVYMWAVLGLHVATDFLIFLLPVPVVLSMKALSRRQRTGLLLIFALGFFVCLISILRIVWIKQLYYSNDFTWDYVAINYWNCIEVNGAILIPCLVVLKPLVRKFWPGFSSSSHEPISGFEQRANAACPGERRQDGDGVNMVDLEGHGHGHVGEAKTKKPEPVYTRTKAEGFVEGEHRGA